MRIFFAELTNSARDFRKKVSGFEFQIVLVDLGHERNVRSPRVETLYVFSPIGPGRVLGLPRVNLG